jgi:hypothetical protein
MTICALVSLATKQQVDYVLTFCQAPIDDDVYIDLPRRWQKLNEMGIKESFMSGYIPEFKSRIAWYVSTECLQLVILERES